MANSNAVEPKVDAELGVLVKTARAALHALRSYQYGNVSPDLAEEVGDELENALEPYGGA